MDMNSRMAYILSAAVNDKENIPIASVLKDLGISKRAFYFELSKTNGWLGYYKLGKIQTVGQQIVMTGGDREEVKVKLREYGSYYFSVRERQAIEMLSIAVSLSPVTLEQMQNFFDVSKSTILSDVMENRKQLLQYSINLKNSSLKGYFLDGDEASIRKAVTRMMQELANYVPRTSFQKMLGASMERLYPGIGDYRETFSVAISDYEMLLQTHLVEGDIDNTIDMIAVSYIRNGKGRGYFMDEQEKLALSSSQEYKVVQLIFNRLSQQNLQISEDEICYITTLFLGVKNFDFKSAVSEQNFIARTTSSIIKNFTDVSHRSFRDSKMLYSRLYLHVKPMYYRIKYGIAITNPLVGKVREMYPDIFEYTQKAVQMTGGEIASLMTENELAYLCIYMASYLKDEEQEETDRKKILIVCGAGVSTSVLIREQLRGFLGDMFQYHLMPAGRMGEVDRKEYIFVVSTVDLRMEEEGVFYTGAILEEKTREKIIRYLLDSRTLHECEVKLKDILDIVEKKIPMDNTRFISDLLMTHYRNLSHEDKGKR